MRTSSRSRGSNATQSSPLVAAWSRLASARAKPAAWASKSSRTATAGEFWAVSPVIVSLVVMSRTYEPARGCELGWRARCGMPCAPVGWRLACCCRLHARLPRGRPELRQALAGYLARARGVQVTPDRIVICSGFTQGLGLICQVLRDRGATTLAVESYSLAAHRDIATTSGLAIATVPVDGHGAMVSELGDAGAVL